MTEPMLGVPYLRMEHSERVTGGAVFLKHGYVLVVDGEDAMPNVYKIARQKDGEVQTGRRSFTLTLVARVGVWVVMVWEQVRRIREVWP